MANWQNVWTILANFGNLILNKSKLSIVLITVILKSKTCLFFLIFKILYITLFYYDVGTSILILYIIII